MLITNKLINYLIKFANIYCFDFYVDNSELIIIIVD